MKTLLKCVLAACLIIGLSYPVFAEVVERSIDTDSSWKCLDVDDRGWTEANYNDSWWESAASRPIPGIAEGLSIWYPSLYPKTVFFRKTFEIDSLDVISANLYYGVADGSNGSIDLYVNGNYIGKFFNTTSNPDMSNITSFLQVGKNVVAVRAEEQDQFYWSLSGIIRYREPEPATYEGGPTMYSGFPGPVQITQPPAQIAQPPVQMPQPNRTPYEQSTGFDSSVLIRSAQYQGYDVTVDGVYIGTDGKGGDPLDGVYSFKVTANQPHTIRVDHPWNWKSWSFWYFAGQNYVYYF